MRERSPLYADGHNEIDTKKLEVEDRKISWQVFEKSAMKWFTGWIVFTFVLVVSLKPKYGVDQSLYVSGYALIIVAGILGYTSAIAGNFTCGWGVIAGEADLITQDLHSARQRMFGKWVGPFIGLVLGFVLLATYS